MKKKCPYEIYVSAYLDDELGPEDKQLIQNHLKYCESCRKVAEDIIAIARYTAPGWIRFSCPDIANLVQGKIARPRKISIPVWQRYYYKLGLAIGMVFFLLRINNFSITEVAIFTGYILGHLIIYTEDLFQQEKFWRQINLCL